MNLANNTFKIDDTTGDIATKGKMDIGFPDGIKGFDVGDGGSYLKDSTGAIILKGYFYDSTAASGSRFTQIGDVSAQVQSSSLDGDRIYLGSPHKFWAVRFDTSIAKSPELITTFYWDGSDLRQMSYMGQKKDSVVSVGDAVLEQTTEKEYIRFDRRINDDWATADDVLDKIPNEGTPLFWMCFQVPAGGFVTAPRFEEIRIRGNSVDFATGIGTIILWGETRVEEHFQVPPSDLPGNQTKTLDLTSVQSVDVPKFRSNMNDSFTTAFRLPEGIDTSCKMELTLDYSANQAIDTADIRVSLFLVKNNITIGAGETSDVVFSDSITVAAADKIITNHELTSLNRIDISSLSEGDSVMAKVERTDANGGEFYPVELVFHYVLWSLGKHV